MGQSLNVVIAGVGGQGTILASRVLAQAALNAGLDARTSETIGMAQREGSVQSHVRIGIGEYGPLIGQGQGDVLLGFEPAEAARAARLMKSGGLALVNSNPIRPITVSLGTAAYQPEEVHRYLAKLPLQLKFSQAFEAAVAAGSFRTVNAVMLGMLSVTGVLPFSPAEMLAVLVEHVPQRARAMNEKAFELGAKL